MSDILFPNGEFFCDFIKLYRQNECLWDKNSNDFRDNSMKRKAYNILHKKYLEVDKNATEKFVRTKIKNLRYRFFKELKKIEKSKEKGDIYEPSSWYFDQLSFIAQREIPKVDVKEQRDKISDIRYWSPTFAKEFISIYKANNCLWNAKLPEFRYKEVKLKAYEELRQKLLAIDKNATIDTVKKRIGSLRTNFNYYLKNLEKMSKSEFKNSETHYIYDLMFLKNQDPEFIFDPENSSRECDSPNELKVFEKMDIEDYRIQSQDDDVLELASNEIFIKRETCDDDKEDFINGTNLEIFEVEGNYDEEDLIYETILDDVEEPFQMVSQNIHNKDESEIEKQKEINQTETISKVTPYKKANKDNEQISNRKKRTRKESNNEGNESNGNELKRAIKVTNTEQSQNISELVPEKLINNENESGTYAKYLANEMRSLIPKDRLFVQKIFNDALFEARLGNTTKLKLTTGN